MTHGRKNLLSSDTTSFYSFWVVIHICQYHLIIQNGSDQREISNDKLPLLINHSKIYLKIKCGDNFAIWGYVLCLQIPKAYKKYNIYNSVL